MTPKLIEDAFPVIIRLWAEEQNIPKYNYTALSSINPLNDDIRLRLNLRFASVQESSQTENVGAIPASLWDWIKYYAKRSLGSFGKHITYKSEDLIRTTHEVYNFCPHHAFEGNHANHMAFLRYGSFSRSVPIPPIAARAAADQLIHTAMLWKHDNYDPMGPVVRELRYWADQVNRALEE